MNRIKELRKLRGMKQEELAVLLNVQRSVVSKYETGRVPLTDGTINKLVEIFGESSDYILNTKAKASSAISSEEALRIAARDMLGRDPTEDELRRFLAMGKVFFDVRE